jgi:four helix bundle protein
MHRTYSFERLDAWQEARKLVKLIYTASEPFPTQELYGIKSQIRRAAVSVSSNIAEGSGRTSSVEQRQFYRMAYSSLMEVLSQIILCNDLDYISIE